ncbi:TasA family protein [Cytobacillus firmus]|uniref:TasA family protein n=1 Tax=Cytobacillus firmus TaxID=1399 RepID=UPI0024C13FCD|nr:TasA family protein [Cytobacillus firmus]WHY35139.1 TasA family protein [Cytobacillus firmus]
MKKMKKALLGTALAGTLVIGAGAGTYSWFNASYKASGTITNHTLTIDEGTSVTEPITFSGKLAPGNNVTGSFAFKNTGSMEQVVQAGLDLQLKNSDGSTSSLNKDMYKIYATVTYNGTTLPTFSGDADDIDSYFAGDTWRPNNGTRGFMPDDTVNVDLKVELKTDAGNEYQGKELYGEVVVRGKQIDAGATYN